MTTKTLILGGARSGKSFYGQQLAESLPGKHIYLATAQAHDAEMAERIARHQADRGEGWQTREEPIDLYNTLLSLDSADHVILLDCLTLWLSNLLTQINLPETEIQKRFHQLAALLPELQSTIIVISNEVGLGLVPATPLGRLFRDLAGFLNRIMAASCSHVVLVTAGLPLALKGDLASISCE